MTKVKLADRAVSNLAAISMFVIALIIGGGVVAIAGVTNAAQSSAGTTVTTTQTVTNATNPAGGFAVDQAPITHYITLTWELSPQALQDRFTPFNIIVAQGDTVHITFIVNDSSAHTFTMGPPYNFQINVTTPGLRNDLTGETFNSSASNNSPGVVISGTPGNITGTGSFVAKYPGVFEYFCVYHVQIGMFGYLTVLPNKAYNSSSSNVTSSTNTSLTQSTNASNPQVGIVYGSAANTTSTYYSPPTITVVIGKNNTVTWVNNDIAPHTVTADNSGGFNSGNINPGQTWTYTFTTPGTYHYHCNYHPWMTGTVIVKSG